MKQILIFSFLFFTQTLFHKAVSSETNVKEWIKVLNSIDSTEIEIEKTLHTINIKGHFDRNLAWSLLDFLTSQRCPNIRSNVAKTYYLLFYDVRGLENSVISFFKEEHRISVFTELLLLEKDDHVRSYIARTGQIMILPFKDQQAFEIAEIYLPLLMQSLLDIGPSVANESIVALQNFIERTPQVFKNSSVEKRLKEIQNILNERLKNDQISDETKSYIEDIIERIGDLTNNN